jgi:sugar O-acyltransferase (sialic acid O-acetyltransferase NeuD family)
LIERFVIVGASGHGREILDIFEAINHVSESWEMAGWIDDNSQLKGTFIRSHPVLGGVEWLLKNGEGLKAIIAIGDPKIRKKIAEKIKSAGINFCTIIHPSVIMTPYVTVGEGTIICAGCIITNNIKIGSHVLINLDTTIGHDTVIEDYVSLMPGIHISGGNTIKEGVYIGTGTTTNQYLTIGEWSIVGAGAVVINDIPPRVTAVGVPAKEIKKLDH